MKLFTVADQLPGTLCIMPKPTLSQLPAMRAAGVGHIVSLLSKPEAARLNLKNEAAACVAAGIAFHQHEIEDFGVPNETTFDELIEKVVTLLNAGASVAVHCRAGVGRSGLTACCLLTRFGRGVDAAIAQVSDARGVTVPETPAQFQFIADFARRHTSVAQTPVTQ